MQASRFCWIHNAKKIIIPAEIIRSQTASVYWIEIFAKTRFPAELIESSIGHGVKTVSFPFDISVEYIPDVLRARDEFLAKSAAAPPPEAPEFADIIHTLMQYEPYTFHYS